jgi:fructosamine-3-kinase
MPARIRGQQRIAGGDINQAIRVSLGEREYFVKLNHARHQDMFQAEALGLEEIGETGALRCPQTVACGTAGETAFLVLEYLPLHRHGHAAELGERLARMHRHTADRYGWRRDNTIGTTRQPNRWSECWIDFWREQRLGWQLELAARKGHTGALQDRGALLLESFAALFEGYSPKPSFLHGDLWGGNHAYLGTGEPVVFDPAVYFGDRESDLAMTQLFGGFDDAFHAAYRDAWPLDEGYRVRKYLYQLYHVLNHLNLFGTSYQAQAEQLIERLLAELGLGH